MGKRIGRSARGNVVDFDLLEITAALAAAPSPAVVSTRRDFIDEKDGLKSRRSNNTSALSTVDVEPVPAEDDVQISDALKIGVEAAQMSERAASSADEKPVSTKGKK